MQSIFSTYSQGENRVTSSIIQVLRNLPINVVEHFLVMFTESDTQSFFDFNNQIKGNGSVPDAEIAANFRILFETKTSPNSINVKQLDAHLKLADEQNTVLVYLTPDILKPKELEERAEKVIWKSFQDLNDLILELLLDPALILSERDQFLLRNLQDFFIDSKLIPIVDEVVIVAASRAWSVYKKYGVYICQAGRSFKDVNLIGFYVDGRIQDKIATIIKRVDHFKVTAEILDRSSPIDEKLQDWLRENPPLESSQIQIFYLSKYDSKDTHTLKKPIENDLRNASGRKYAFTQGQRYTSLSKLNNSETTGQLIT